MQNKEKQKETVPAENQKKKPKRKKKGKVAEVYALHTKGVGVKEIAKKMKLNERIVRSYIWRAKNPEKYRKLLQRYFERRKKEKASKTSIRPSGNVKNKKTAEEKA